MNLIRLLKYKSGSFFIMIALLGIVNSLVYGSIMVFINNVIAGEGLPFLAAPQSWVYAGLLVVSFLLNKTFQTYIARLTNSIVFEYESGVIDKLRVSTFESFEKLGAQRVYTAIQDTRLLAQVPSNFVNAINSVVIILCGLSYMFWLSWKAGAMIMCFMGLLLAFYLLRNNSIEKQLNEVRDLQNDYHRYLRDFLNGFREIKMSLTRNNSIYERYIKRTLLGSKELNDRTAVRYLENELTGNYSWYVVLGLILFVMPQVLNIPMTRITAFVFTILYIMGPLATLISSVPFFTRLKIAVERIDGLEKEIDTYPQYDLKEQPVELSRNFTSLEFRNAAYEYKDAAGKKLFAAGPFNISIKKGEIIFITGGNGSGKSTFINLLTGIYMPTHGSLLYNGQPLVMNSYPHYSDRLSAIFTGVYLFNENYDGFDLDENNPVLQKYLTMMELDEVVRFDPQKKSIDNKLSMGQRKRLALIYALMEKRDVLVLDEWAAEQDPHFRAYFYEQIIPILKQMNKTVIAVTHDDKYYGQADRILHFDFGKVAGDVKLQHAKQPELVK